MYRGIVQLYVDLDFGLIIFNITTDSMFLSITQQHKLGHKYFKLPWVQHHSMFLVLKKGDFPKTIYLFLKNIYIFLKTEVLGQTWQGAIKLLENTVYFYMGQFHHWQHLDVRNIYVF